jgi:uncharacterized protein (TIGR02118 family)
MYKLIAIYKIPADMNKFTEHYEKTHMPITKKIPGLKEVRLNKVFGTPRGKSDLHIIAELCFESKEAFKSSMSTPEAMASGKDLMGFAGELVSVHFAEEIVEKF